MAYYSHNPQTRSPPFGPAVQGIPVDLVSLCPVPLRNQIELVSILRDRLHSAPSGHGPLKSMPPGFPFQYARDRSGRLSTCYDSYDFYERLHLPCSRQVHNVSFAFTAPTSQQGRYLTWRIHLQNGKDATPFPAKVAVSTVQVEPTLMNTPYGKFIRTDPQVILRALSLSLELGVMVTISLRKYHPCLNDVQDYWADRCNPNAVIYIATNNEGRSMVIHNDYYQ